MAIKLGMISADLPEAGKKPGGVHVAVHELANALVKIGHSVQLHSYSPEPEGALYTHARLPHIVQDRRLNRRLMLPLQLNFVDTQDIDLLHLHGDDWAFINRSVPTVRTFHGCAFNEAKFADTLKGKLVHSIYHPLEQLANQLATVSVGVGDDPVDLLGAQGVIANGYDRKVFYPGEKAARPTAIVIGTLEGRKRSRQAIELLLSLRDRIPELNIHAVIDRPYDHPAVNSWIGISQQQLAQLIRESWIGVSTTQYEGFGIYYIEWMASGTVPITFSNVGVRGLIKDAEAGVVADDIETLRQAALKLLSSPAQLETYAKNAVAAAEPLTWEHIARQYSELYSQILQPRAVSAG
ncbi:MAG: glycosyltransferase family 4 protein [Cyanobacteria bacterium J06623_5]